jgi:hypothetical protein
MRSYCWFVRGEAHKKLAAAAVAKADPSAQTLINYDESDAPIMLANLEAQVHALLLGQDGDEYTFLDTDVLLLKPIPRVGNLTVTWRSHVYQSEDGEKVSGVATAMPYNYGVIVAKRTPATVEAFIWLRERIRKMGKNEQEWYGNQIALAELAGPCPKVGTAIEERRIPWLLTSPGRALAVGKIPCELYNYTPSKADEDIGQRYALHFKGKSRGLMEGYARNLGLGWHS